MRPEHLDLLEIFGLLCADVCLYSDETKHTIKAHFSELVDIAFGSKGINFNAHGVKRMLLTYAKAFCPSEHQRLKDKYFL